MRPVLTLLLLGGCVSKPAPLVPPLPPSTLQVATLSLPVDWLVRRIGAGAIDVTLAVPVDQDPAHYHPSGDEIAALSQADLIVYNGAGYEAWLSTATLPQGKLLDSSRDLDLIDRVGQTHSHGVANRHSHIGKDPYTWTDAASFLLQGREIHAALVRARPLKRAAFDAGLSSVEASLTRLDAEAVAALEPMRTKRMASSAPMFKYLARRTGVQIKGFDLANDALPSAGQLRDFNRWRGGQTDPVLFWVDAPTHEVKVAFPLGVRHIVLDPLDDAPTDESYDYVVQFRKNVNTLRAEFVLGQ